MQTPGGRAECKDVTEFEQLADSFGIKFNSEDSAEKLYSMLNNSSRQIDIDVKGLVNRAELTDEQLASVIGGVNWKKFWKGVGIGLAVVGAVVLTGGVGAAIGGAVGAGTAAASAFVASAATASVVGAGAAVAAGGVVATAVGTGLAVGMDKLESAAGGVGSDYDIDDSLKIESEL